MSIDELRKLYEQVLKEAAIKEAKGGPEHLRLRTRLDDLADDLEIERKFTQLDDVLPDVCVRRELSRCQASQELTPLRQ